MKRGVERQSWIDQCHHWRGYTKGELAALKKRLKEHPEEDYDEEFGKARIYCRKKTNHKGPHRDHEGKKWRHATPKRKAKR